MDTGPGSAGQIARGMGQRKAVCGLWLLLLLLVRLLRADTHGAAESDLAGGTEDATFVNVLVNLSGVVCMNGAESGAG